MPLKLLVALDGSETSRRAVRHVAHVLRSRPDAAVTIFHACPDPPSRLETGGAEAPRLERAIEAEQRELRHRWEDESRQVVEDEIFSPARRVLVEAGVSESSVAVRAHFDAVPHPDVARAIMDEAEAIDADAVVIGRRRSRSKIQSLLLGSVSSRVVQGLGGRAVWVVE